MCTLCACFVRTVRRTLLGPQMPTSPYRCVSPSGFCGVKMPSKVTLVVPSLMLQGGANKILGEKY